MTANPFAAPAAASSGIQWADHKGRLLVIEPLESVTGIQTSFGDADAVRANIHIIDGDAPASFDDGLVFPKILASQLRPKIGQKVIGRLSQGQAKPGQSAPWMLAEASEADVQAGVTWLNSQQTGQLAQPAATGQPDAGNPPF